MSLQGAWGSCVHFNVPHSFWRWPCSCTAGHVPCFHPTSPSSDSQPLGPGSHLHPGSSSVLGVRRIGIFRQGRTNRDEVKERRELQKGRERKFNFCLSIKTMTTKDVDWWCSDVAWYHGSCCLQNHHCRYKNLSDVTQAKMFTVNVFKFYSRSV